MQTPVKIVVVAAQGGTPHVRPLDKTFFATGALFAMLGVAAGAFGAHALSGRLTPEHLATYETAARYQMYHALGLMVIAWAIARWPDAHSLACSGRLMIAGIIVFCVTLYAIA